MLKSAGSSTNIKTRKWALGLLCFVTLLLDFGHITAQENPAPTAQAAPGEAPDAAKAKADKVQEFEGLIQRRVKTLLSNIVDDMVSRRISRSSYNISIEAGINKQILQDWAKTFDESESTTLRSELMSRDYEGLRMFVQEATISLGFSSKISQAEWDPIVAAVQSTFETEAGAVETVEGQTATLPATPEERMLETQLAEARKAAERNSELRQSEIELEKELELENANEIEKQTSENLRQDVAAERAKREALTNQMLTEQNIKERMIKEWPATSRFLYSGLGIGLVFLIGGLLVGTLVYFGIRSLGGAIVISSEGIAEALMGPKETTVLNKKLEPFGTEDENAKDELNEDPLIEFDAKPEFKEAAEQLKLQVLRDVFTTGSVLSKVAEQEKCGEVVGIFDILGPEIAQRVFDHFTPSAKRTIQRAFFNGEIKRVGANTLFNRINELRMTLSTTDVLMREKSDKTFAQIAISFSEDEIAKALKEVQVFEASHILSIFPPDRMFRILRQMTSDTAKDILLKVGRSVTDEAKLSVELIERFASNLMDETKVRYEEQKRYFKSLLAASTDDEAEIIAQGLEFNSRLLLDVIGMRATTEDLWAQATDVIDSLLALVELEASSYFLFLAPAPIQTAVLQGFPERKRILTQDSLSNYENDKEMRANAAKSLGPTKKIILTRLSEMAQQGTVTLPSYERLKQMADEQQQNATLDATVAA